MLMEKVHVEIRAMDDGMAARTCAFGLKTHAAMRHIDARRRCMALETEHSFFPARQQLPVHAAVRRVTRRAPFHLDGGMFEHKGTTLLRVALRACVPARLRQFVPVRRSVWRMAIGALHEAFRHPVMRGQSELRPDIAMAVVAKFRLALLQKAAVEPATLLRQ